MKEKIENIVKKVLNRETIMYLVFGVLATVVSIGSYRAAVVLLAGGGEETNIIVNIANLISWIITVSFAYVTNKVWVFQSRSMEPKVLFKEIISFFGARVFSLGFEIVWMNGLMWLFGEQYNFIYKIGAQVGIVIMNYVFSKLFIFKKK